MRISLPNALRNGRSPQLSVTQLIDEEWYLAKYPDVAAAGLSAESHYFSTGWAEGRSPNAFFDGKWYFQQNPDVDAAGMNPLVHYFEHGWREGRNPHPDFDTRYYLDSYADVAAANMNPLLHFVLEGRKEGRLPCPPNIVRAQAVTSSLGEQPLPPPPAPMPARPKTLASTTERLGSCFFDVTKSKRNDEIVDLIRERSGIECADPQVTIIIPVYKNTRYTLRCLLSIVSATDTTPYKIVIADDHSPDGSGLWLKNSLAGIANLSVSINAKNLGFLKSCNEAAKLVTTPYLFLLNNDTFVLNGWLDELAGVFSRYPGCGLAGSKLIYPDGKLQEAGGIVWRDASGANFGRGQDARKPEFNYQRDVDYISAASVMTPTQVWRELGGFSEEFAPAYYEDTDYAMKVRQKGMRVIYQPLSEVIHFEGVSSGTDITQGVKSYQAVNKETFQKKWANELAQAGDPADFARHIVDRKTRGRILVYDAETPRPDKDSGSVTAFQNMKILGELGLRVTFVPQNLLWCNKHSRALQRLGVEVIHAPYQTNARSYVLDHAGKFDVIMLSRAPIGGELIDEVRNKYPNLPIIFDSVDIHHLRMLRQYDLDQDPSVLEAALRMKQVELNAIRKADLTLIVSKAEVEYVNDEIGPFPYSVLPLIYEPYTPVNAFADRRDIAFVGGFRHTPNVDAVEYLVNEVWPLIRKRNIGARLHIIGSHMPKEFNRFASEDILPIGYVEQLEPYMEKIKISLAPLRYGAGVKGKVGNSLRMGVPVVGTPIAIEGMNLRPDVHVKVGATATEFADAVAELYLNEAAWTRISRAGRDHVMEIFGTRAATRTLRGVVNSLV